MSYPMLEINLKKLQDNVKYEVDLLCKLGIEVMGVNKVFNGLYETAEATVKAGMKVIAESRVNNLKKLKNLSCEKALLRTPALSEIEDVVKYADISLNSEIEVVKAISEEAVRQKRIHKILIMLDLGDIREGIWFENKEEIEDFIEEAIKLPNIEIYGIGSNFSCYGTILPSIENINLMVNIARGLESKFNIKFKYLSAGNATTYHLIDKGIFLEGINNLRIGALHEFGIEYVCGNYVDGFYHSNMDVNKYVSNLYIFKAEIIELNTKPTVPVGELGVDAFLKKKSFVDRGKRKRAILAFGKQDVSYENLQPVDCKIEILGQTSDHTIIDIEDCSKVYNLGDIIDFEIDYTALMLVCNSADIQKSYIYD
jgi:ornithine racemase